MFIWVFRQIDIVSFQLPVDTRLQISLTQTKIPQHITASHTHLFAKRIMLMGVTHMHFRQKNHI